MGIAAFELDEFRSKFEDLVGITEDDSGMRYIIMRFRRNATAYI